MNDRIEFLEVCGTQYQRTYNPLDHGVALDQFIDRLIEATPRFILATAVVVEEEVLEEDEVPLVPFGPAALVIGAS